MANAVFPSDRLAVYLPAGAPVSVAPLRPRSYRDRGTVYCLFPMADHSEFTVKSRGMNSRRTLARQAALACTLATLAGLALLGVLSLVPV